jgi:hypothetical protein
VSLLNLLTLSGVVVDIDPNTADPNGCDITSGTTARALTSDHFLAVNNHEQSQSPNVGSRDLGCADQGIPPAGRPSFAHTMLQDLRATTYQTSGCVGAGSTDLRLHHLFIFGAYADGVGIHRRITTGVQIDRAQCMSDADCRIETCTGDCVCLALGPGEQAPASCNSPLACIIDPCARMSAACVANQCTFQSVEAM